MLYWHLNIPSVLFWKNISFGHKKTHISITVFTYKNSSCFNFFFILIECMNVCLKRKIITFHISPINVEMLIYSFKYICNKLWAITHKTLSLNSFWCFYGKWSRHSEFRCSDQHHTYEFIIKFPAIIYFLE